jgi:sugar/nucleoside kinase (ribokinase family)
MAPRKRRLGVIGTLVWDVIHGWPPGSEPVEDWGGIAYALSALAAALPDSWEIVPIMKVGQDVAGRAEELLSNLRNVAKDAAPVVVPQPNNRSEIHYYNEEHRDELLSGRTPAWEWSELELQLRERNLDALYVNFVSGWELNLDSAKRLRATFRGPIYADLHMMLWVPQSDGLRALQPLSRVPEWLGCFDLVQVNEQEMTMLAGSSEELAAEAFRAGVLCTVITLGARGVIYYASPDMDFAHISAARERRTTMESARSELVAPSVVRAGAGMDPTGCGDIWGATFFSRLLLGDAPRAAIRVAHEAASCSASRRGVSGLVDHLLGTGNGRDP